MPSTSEPVEWAAWRLTVPDWLAEEVLAHLLAISPQGLVDETPAPQRRRFTVYIPAETWQRQGTGHQEALRRLAAARDATIDQELRLQAEEDWWALSRRFFHAFPVGERLRIRPPWEAAVDDGRQEIIIDPGRSFGTGLHETTRLCLELMEAQLTEGARVLDLGTGTGILALAAARLGARRVLALDVDPHAVEGARQNVARNGLTDRVTVAEGTLPLERWGPFVPAPPYDLVVANIIRQVLEPMGPALAQLLAPASRLIVSGLLGSGVTPVRERYSQAGLVLLERRRRKEWVALLFAPAEGS